MTSSERISSPGSSSRTSSARSATADRPALPNRELDSEETRRVAEPVVPRCDPLGEHCRRLARLPQPDEAASDVERPPDSVHGGSEQVVEILSRVDVEGDPRDQPLALERFLELGGRTDPDERQPSFGRQGLHQRQLALGEMPRLSNGGDDDADHAALAAITGTNAQLAVRATSLSLRSTSGDDSTSKTAKAAASLIAAPTPDASPPRSICLVEKRLDVGSRLARRHDPGAERRPRRRPPGRRDRARTALRARPARVAPQPVRQRPRQGRSRAARVLRAPSPCQRSATWRSGCRRELVLRVLRFATKMTTVIAATRIAASEAQTLIARYSTASTSNGTAFRRIAWVSTSTGFADDRASLPALKDGPSGLLSRLAPGNSVAPLGDANRGSDQPC